MRKAIFGFWWAVNALLLLAIMIVSFRMASTPEASGPFADLDPPVPLPPEPLKKKLEAPDTALLRELPNPLSVPEQSGGETKKHFSRGSALSDIALLHGIDRMTGDARSATAYLYLPSRKIEANAYYGEVIRDGVTGREIPELAGWRLAGLVPGGALFRNGPSEVVLTLRSARVPWSPNVYRMSDNFDHSNGPSFAAVWQDISTSAAVLPIMGEDAHTTIAVPLLIKFFGSYWGTAPADSGISPVSSKMLVSANLYLALLAPGQEQNLPIPLYINHPLPRSGDARIDPGGFIAVLWDQLGARSPNDIAHWAVVGTAPNRRLIVQWTNWSFGGSTDDMTVQVQITESDGVRNSEIRMIYQGVNTPQEEGNSATIGIQAPNGSAVQYAFESAGSTTADSKTGDPRVIRFYPPGLPPDAAARAKQIGAFGEVTQSGWTGRHIVFQADVTDPDEGQQVALQVQVRKTGQPWPIDSMYLDSGFQDQGTIAISYPIAAAGDYDWRYRVVDADGQSTPLGSWTEFMDNSVSPDFMSDQTPPAAPAAASPTDTDIAAAAAVVVSVDFTWRAPAGDGPADSLRYEIEVSRTADFSDIEARAANLAAPAARFNLTVSPEKKYWRVRCVDHVGNVSEWSDIAGFRLVWKAASADQPDR
ncbi:MAG: hypothetical protein HY716_06325 [Planctomycetes bacterium]|nr:hypothetical protein [Planctomycetota bacterium]